MNTILELLPISVEHQFNKDFPVEDLKGIINLYLGEILIHNDEIIYEGGWSDDIKTMKHYQNVEFKCSCGNKKKLYFIRDVDNCILDTNGSNIPMELICKKCCVEILHDIRQDRQDCKDWGWDYESNKIINDKIKTVDKQDWQQVLTVGMMMIEVDKNKNQNSYLFI